MPPRIVALIRSRRGAIAIAAVGFVALMAVVVLSLRLGAAPSASAQPTAPTIPTPSPSYTAKPDPTPTSTLSPSPSPEPSPEATCPFSGLRGSLVPLAEPVLISLDNAPEARPATGLNAADIVFENPVQGNSTRFVALFACDSDVRAVGPVRSGRWIQVDLWRQLRVLPIIYGAAGYTTSYFAANGMPYIDGNVEPWPFFYRIQSRPAPYNVYLDMPALQELIETNGALAALAEEAGEPRPLFTFEEDWRAPVGVREVTALTLRTASFWSFGWQFDAESNMYQRVDAGAVTTDAATGEPLIRRTIIVQRAPSHRTFADADPTADPPLQELVGTGDGVVYVDGIAIDVIWTRQSDDAVTEWTIRETGEALVLPPGQIWWEVIQTSATVMES